MRTQGRLALTCVDRGIEIRCEDPAVRDALWQQFDAMSVPDVRPDVRYRISGSGGAMDVVRCNAELVGRTRDLGQLLYQLDSDIVIQLQRMRPDLLFLHAAALTNEQGAHLLIGPSGAGKSTTCWGLLRGGMGYLSDELAPIHVPDVTVRPFPRALHMKAAPPAGFELAPETPRTSRGYHVPVARASLGRTPAARPVRTLVFVRYEAGRRHPRLRRVTSAEAAARLYPNVLNALSHEADAMPAVTRVASAATAFVVDAADLAATCGLIRANLAR